MIGWLPALAMHLLFLFCFVFVFLGPHPWHMEVHRLGVKLGAAAAGLHHSNVGAEPHL